MVGFFRVRSQNTQGLYVAKSRDWPVAPRRLISVPVTSVLYVLAISCFISSAYYGFRLSRVTKVRVLVMVTQDGPVSISRGLALLSITLVLKMIESFTFEPYTDFLDLSSSILLVVAAVVTVIGFEKMYSAYNNERIRSNVYSTLEELRETEFVKENDRDLQSLR